MKIKKGDNVLIIKGKDRGRTGKVLRVLPSLKKVIVEKVNIIKKHLKPKSQGKKGEIIHIEAPFSISNVKLICPNCTKATRAGFLINQDSKTRICKKCQKPIN
jgi:large subunit ribosomal protein L24